MSALISTWPRRMALAALTMMLAAIVMVELSMKFGPVPISELTMGDWMKRLILVPGLLAFVTFVFTTVVMQTSARATNLEAEVQTKTVEADPAESFMAQIVGLEWLNPLQRRDYPTEWQILWTMGLVKPNQNDDMVQTMPEKFASFGSIGALVYGNHGTETFKGFYHKYVEELLGKFGDRYALNAKYFYTVKPDNKKDWRELAGIHVEFAIPDRLDPLEAQTYLRKKITSEFCIGSRGFPTLWSRDTPPDVHVTPGGPNAGFTSLNNALDYLQANPDKSVWVMNWDAPGFPPRDGQLNENMVLLFLAGPNFKTERAPLAWIGRAATGDVQSFERKVGTTRAVEAWKATIAQAAHHANVPTTQIEHVIYDAGMGSEVSSERIGSLARTLTETLLEFDYQKQTFNTPRLLGDMGAGTALTNVVLAIGRANHFGETVLVAGTTDADHPVAVVVTPPPQVVPIDPNADWFRARGENNAYLPWWGRRYDSKYGMQGFSW
ncbi:virulence factor [Paraburkholderia sp. D15]|uniref:virulence factor n=1 Tax=Paraburkholderia sp. D15 TaxID=2880218 RepID=UPI00247AC835|nr:virulence factor [Paraburkholderia sp. D15]WGS53171.1 virulence factor [Paraburkholderia sp. D15]